MKYAGLFINRAEFHVTACEETTMPKNDFMG